MAKRSDSDTMTIEKGDVGKLSDELNLPTPPSAAEAGTAGAAGDAEGSCDAEIPDDLYAGLPDQPEALPKGVSEFRVDSYEEKAADGDGQPYFNLKLVCQTEPNVGRVIFDFVQWVKEEDVRDAKDVSSPRNAQARAILKERLWKSKQLTNAARFKPSGGMRFKDFLATQPVVKVSHKQKPKKEATGVIKKDGKKEYKATSDMQAVVDKYLPMT